MHKDRWRKAEQAKTLMQAHDALSALRPAPQADANTWREYYRRSAAVYAEIAEVDRGHHHESLYWADRERTKADEITEQLRQKKSSHRAINAKSI